MAQRQYIGPRFVLKIYENSVHANSADWEANTSYEPLIMVTYNSTSYVSKKFVPPTVGNPTSNPEYWCVMASYNAQIDNLQNQINDINDEITMFKDIFYIVTPDMTQAEIQEAVATYNNIYFSVGEYHYKMPSNGQAYVLARPNMNIWIDGTIIWDRDAYADGSIIGIKDVDNVKVFGHGTLVGNKYTHDSVSGTSELENCISIIDSSNITIEGLTCKKAWGDGIMIAGINPARDYKSTDIYINNVVCDDNRRNGISMSSADRCIVTNSKFVNTGKSVGTAPMAGIAVETDGPEQTMNDISFVNCISRNNVSHSAYVTAHSDSYVRFDGCTLISSSNVDAFPLYPGAESPAMNVVVRDCVIEGRTGVKITNFNSNCKFDIQSTTFQHIAEALIETDSLINECVLKGAVIDSNFAYSLFKCFSGDSNIITKCIFELELINTTSAETGRPYFINKDNTLVKITNNTIRHFTSESEVPLTFTRYEYDDADYTAGIRNINVIDGCHNGSEYIIHNSSAHDLGIYTGGSIPTSGTDPVSVKAGKAVIVKRFNSSVVMCQYLNQ